MHASELMADGCTFADIPKVEFPATVAKGIARRMRHPKMALYEFQVLDQMCITVPRRLPSHARSK